MRRIFSPPALAFDRRAPSRGCANVALALILAFGSGSGGRAIAAPYVEFDFAPFAECRDVTPPGQMGQYATGRLVEVLLPVSVRLHGVPLDDLEELDIEISGAAAGLRVHDFAPATQLTSDVSKEIETTTTTKRARSLDGSLGGALPVPYGELVAHVTPTINAGISGSETATEKINRLPPKYASVVSGTSLEGRGVFYKIKRTSQTSLEGVHEFAVTFVAPPQLQRTELQIVCSAHGKRKVLWMKQSTTLGEEQGSVRLAMVRAVAPRQVVMKPVADAKPTTNHSTWQPTRPEPGRSKTSELAVHTKAHKHPTDADDEADTAD